MEARMKFTASIKSVTRKVLNRVNWEEIINLIGRIHNSFTLLTRLVKMRRLIKKDSRILFVDAIEKV